MLLLFYVCKSPADSTPSTQNLTDQNLPNFGKTADVPQSPSQSHHQEITHQDAEEKIRDTIQHFFLKRFGSQGRRDYFHNAVLHTNQHDHLYREVFEELSNDPHFSLMLVAVDEWVKIGFNTLVEWRTAWKNTGTLNQLYIAAHAALLQEEPPLNFNGGDITGIHLATRVSNLVAQKRRASV